MYNKPLIAFVLIACIMLGGCAGKKSFVLNQANLPSSFFSIPTDKDTSITTTKGTVIVIPAGAFKGAKDGHVKLELKEAYSITDMIAAGLTTKAGKEQLSSGGMFFINTPEDKDVTIAKAINISVPTTARQKGMQLYKGDSQANGTIDWTAPQPIPEPTLSEHLQKGKALFNNNCASCHNTLKDATGPALAYLNERRDKMWLEHFVYNSAEMIAHSDPLAVYIYNRYNKTAMTAFPTMSGEDIAAIMDYATYEARSKGIGQEQIPDIRKSFDSCLIYCSLVDFQGRRRQALVDSNGAFATVDRGAGAVGAITGADTAAVKEIIALPSRVMPEVVQQAQVPSEYYKVAVTAVGWYNVDILTKGLPGFEESELMVRLKGSYNKQVTMYMALPSHKILLDGGLLDGKDDIYGFYATDGKIPLPQSVPAYIIATGEQDGQLYFGVTTFTTGLKQAPEIRVSVTTKEQMNITIKKLDIGDLSIQADKSKNADSIIKIDEILKSYEKYKPQHCDCEMFYPHMKSEGDSAR